MKWRSGFFVILRNIATANGPEWALAVFSVKATVMLVGFIILSNWHTEIVSGAYISKSDPYPLVHSVTRLLPSPNWDVIGVPINLFFHFGIWPGALVAFAVAILWRTDTVLQACGSVIFGLAYVIMTSDGYASAWLAFLNDLATAVIMFFVATIPFTVIGRKVRYWVDSIAKTNTTAKGD